MKRIHNVWTGLALWLAFFPCNAQDHDPKFVLRPGTSEAAISATYKTPFGKMRVNASDDNARMGVPVGLWQVYHVTSVADRMYVTILHFSATKADGQPLPSAVVDAIMLYPGHWAAAQILSDQPGIASTCSAGCEIVRATDKSGAESVLLQPQKISPQSFVIYFVGDSATITSRNVSSLQSTASWVYVLHRADFDKSCGDLSRQVIGIWRPSA
jgi:hypothetical protein